MGCQSGLSPFGPAPGNARDRSPDLWQIKDLSHRNEVASLSTFTVPPVHREGWKFVALFAAVAVVLFILWEPLGWVGVIATCWCAYFFRDPARITPNREGLVISPADGVVQMIQPAIPPA